MITSILFSTISVFYIIFGAFYAVECRSRDYYIEVGNLNIIYVNKNYFRYFDVYTGRAGRCKPYSLSINVSMYDPSWSYGASGCFEVWEKTISGYHFSSILYNDTLCHWLRADMVIWPMVMMFSKLPNKCPLPTDIVIKNSLAHTDFLPEFIPFKEFMLVLKLFKTKTKERAFDVSLTWTKKKLPKITTKPA